jgi:hypothetical protein
MLSHPTLDQLHALGLHGMVKGFKNGGPGAFSNAPSFCVVLPSLLPEESEFFLRNAIREEEQEAILGCLE